MNVAVTPESGTSTGERSPIDRSEVQFFSGGERIAADLLLPTAGASGSQVPAVVQGPGWLGLRDAKLYVPFHRALLDAGIAVLVLDYRGFGGSGGDPTTLDLRAQVDDIRAGVTYLETLSEVAPHRIGIFGSGGTGGGNAILAAAHDDRIRAVVSQVPIADGQQWLRGMRTEGEWIAFKNRLRDDSRRRVRDGQGDRVSPREEIMVPTAERKTTSVKADVDDRVPSLVELASAQSIIDYRPVDAVWRISPRPLLLICVEHDETTPEDHAFRLFEAARAPKRLIVQTGTTHYRAYADFVEVMPRLIATWLRSHLIPEEVSFGHDPIWSIEYLAKP